MQISGSPPARRERGGHARRVVALVVAATVSLQLSPAWAACTPVGDALLILDASSSMLRVTSSGATRFNLARQAISATVDLFPNEASIALRLYGSQTQAVRRNCSDSVLAVPFSTASRNRSAIKLALASSHARGLTPIAYALQEARKDFSSAATGRTIILISDGGESCGGEPCAIAVALADEGFVINTIGLGTDVRDQLQLRCVAMATGGEYFNVPVAAELQEKLAEALGVCPVADRTTFPRYREAFG
jgi:Ca-activated chloride channel family protein